MEKSPLEKKLEQREPVTLKDPHKPKFPVIFENPTAQQVRDNITQADCVQAAVAGGICFPMGYIIGRQLGRSLARPGMLFAGVLGSLGGAMLAYQNASLRLQGFGRNDEEVARFLGPKPEPVDSSESKQA